MPIFLTILISLAAVIGLIILTLYATRKLMKKFNFRGDTARGIRILDCAGIGQDKFIAAVQAGGKKLLLGVTSAEISVLCELDDEDIAAMFPPEEEQGGKSFGDYFAESLAEKLKGGKKDGSGKKDGNG